MKRALLGLALLLAGCQQTANTGTGGLPLAKEVATFSYPKLPSGGAVYYLAFVDQDGVTALQKDLAGGSSSVEVDISTLAVPTDAQLKPALSLLPTGATGVSGPTPSDVRVRGLTPTIFRDGNGNSRLDPSEVVYDTNDAVLYASKAFSGSYGETVNGRTVNTSVSAQGGWTRLEHYVYKPLSSSAYIRSLKSTANNAFRLDVPTPVYSM